MSGVQFPSKPVAVVVKENDYWNRGHFHEGKRHVIQSIGNIDTLPVGTRLFAEVSPEVGPPWCCEKGEALNVMICPECAEACAAYSAASGVALPPGGQKP